VSSLEHITGCKDATKNLFLSSAKMEETTQNKEDLTMEPKNPLQEQNNPIP
jgi:hypothetical protein